MPLDSRTRVVALAVLLVVIGLGVAHNRGQAAGERESAESRVGARRTGSWVARPLGKIEAVGINDRGEIAGFYPNGGWPGGKGVALWRNGRWTSSGIAGAGNEPLPPLDNDEPFRTPAVINDRGEVLIDSRDATSGWLWQGGRKPTRLRFYPSELNDRGDVVGSRDTARRDPCYDDAIQRAIVWQNGKTRVIATLSRFKDPGSIDVYADAINDRGEVSGTDSDNCGDDRAFIWRNGTVRDLGALGGAVSRAIAINNRGQIVGSATTGHGILHAFLWQNGTMRDLGDWWPIAINDRGQIVGTSYPSSGQVHAVLWQNGTLRDLGALPGDHDSGPIGINDSGQIIGVSYEQIGHLADPPDGRGPDEVGPGARPFIWENGHMTALPIPQPNRHGLAVAISNSGEIIGWDHDGSVLWTR